MRHEHRTPATPTPRGQSAPIRALGDLAFSRAAGSPLVEGNTVRVLRNGAENYPAWEHAIQNATRTVHMEMYIVRRDAVGHRFVELLADKARQGVQVRVLYDWFGCGTGPLLGVFRPLVKAGGDVRCFNPPRFTAVLGWTRRNHRKLITVDSETAFISGICMADHWRDRPERKLEGWRDTGVEITGPAVAFAEHAFSDTWRFAGGALAPSMTVQPEDIKPTGDVALRIIPTEPFAWNMLQMDLLVTTMARKRLWITDAYFLGHGPYVEALRRAAADDVDVRLLLPQGSDVGWTVPASRTLYRTLLEAGVRIFEWNGPMIHAKTAVADGRWARIGSTNLNLSSWLGNWELDVAVEDERVAQTLEQHYEEDLGHSTEIVLATPIRRPAGRPMNARARARRSARRVMRTVSGISRSIGAAVTGNRQLEEFEFAPLLTFGVVLLIIAVLVWANPRALAWIVVVMTGWTGLSFIWEAVTMWRRRGK